MKSRIPCLWMRGGTSKGGCFVESDLPADIKDQDALLSRIYGSNDSSGRQIDGMGGATSTTSKAVIVGKRFGEKNGVNYSFAQVDIASSLVDRKGNCGNMSSTVGPFAVEMGLVDEITEPVTLVEIYNTNTKKTIISHVPVKDGKVVYEGNYTISGVPGTAARIQLDFLKPGGAVTGQLLPTGKEKEMLEVPGVGMVEVSIVDAANPLVFVRASDLGLKGDEMPKDIDTNPDLLDKMLAIREAAAVKVGLASDIADAKKNSPAVPKFCFVAPPAAYTSVEGDSVERESIDLQARMLSMGKLHPVLAITGGICIGVAAKIPGTLVNEAVGSAANQEEIRIGHCSGVLAVGAEVQKSDEGMVAVSGTVYRTARILMSGDVNIR